MIVMPTLAKVNKATQKLFLEVSPVGNRRDPHIWVAEFTNQVEWRPRTVRKKMPYSTNFHPPATRRITPSVVIGAWHCEGRERKGKRFAASLCMVWPVRSQPTCAPKTTFAWRIWVAFLVLVLVLVMLTMYRNPENRAPFQGQRAAYGQRVLHRLVSLIPSMRNPPQNHRDRNVFQLKTNSAANAPM